MTAEVGDRVQVNDPTWHRHSRVGTVVKVNCATIRVRLDGETTDTIGSPIFFRPVPEPDALGAWAARTYDDIMGK